ncbi:Hypothetical protein SMAX5B_018176 [Scophthalmus maximus]|uniref:Uncharacterized protein n=1 Tax=Scophthalmus maximus TaxID=52904 RepID=A0A2U9CC40_SCOMX|nr:Hypothetical protein SMAX5B_018176 [Scophthalmus maximus]
MHQTGNTCPIECKLPGCRFFFFSHINDGGPLCRHIRRDGLQFAHETNNIVILTPGKYIRRQLGDDFTCFPSAQHRRPPTLVTVSHTDRGISHRRVRGRVNIYATRRG